MGLSRGSIVQGQSDSLTRMFEKAINENDEKFTYLWGFFLEKLAEKLLFFSKCRENFYRDGWVS